jgi:hypothetical protein
VADLNGAWRARHHRRWMHENAQLYIRPDDHRFMRPLSQNRAKSSRLSTPKRNLKIDQFEDITKALRLEKYLFDEVNHKWALLKIKWLMLKYSASQPRIPAGNADGGRRAVDERGREWRYQRSARSFRCGAG